MCKRALKLLVILAIYLPVIIFSLISSPTHAFDVTNAFSVSVYGTVDKFSKTDRGVEDSTIVDCNKGYQLEGNKCVLNCPNYYDRINSKCTDYWIGGGDKNSSGLSMGDNTGLSMGNNTTTPRLGSLNFTESKK